VGGTTRRFGAGIAAPAVVILVLLVWLWPIGVGGKMLVGGDVTHFFLGLMGFLSQSLREHRLPVWNDLWGYGFPGLGESQMGVFYPLHWLLYGCFATETAYTLSLVIHTLWGGLGVLWAAGRLGVSRIGSALAAFAWSTGGFFLIHLAHPWSYTTGSWMPWAFGLTWSIIAPGRARRNWSGVLLSLVLVLQVLPGHFQLGFQTQVGIALIVIWAVAEKGWSYLAGRISGGTTDLTVDVWRVGAIMLAVVAVLPLAALQLLPTARLAALAAAQRDFEYLSGFAATPFHLVSWVAPGLFHRSPLWRPLVWDPFHTSPEELLGYVGLVPLFLACSATVREFRRDAAVRCLAVIALAGLVFSLGPYAPGFHYLIKVPGFSFFRAPARWDLMAALAVAILAGKGFDRWEAWPRVGRSLVRFAAVTTAWVLLTLGVMELALASTARPSLSGVAQGFERAFQALPWSGDPGFRAVLALADQPQPDPRLPPGLAQSMVLQKQPVGRVFASQRGWIYAKELGETALLLLVLGRLGWRCGAGEISTRVAKAALIVLTFLDLCVLGQHRLLDVGPIRPLVEQSPVLARLAEQPRGSRIADLRLRNLPMLIGLAPISAYRTLDLPAVSSLTALAQQPLSGPVFGPLVRRALRATGTRIRVFDPVENRTGQLLLRPEESREVVEDRALAGWLFEQKWAAEQTNWARTFRVLECGEGRSRAWLVPMSTLIDSHVLDSYSGDPREILPVFDEAEALAWESPRPEEVTIRVAATEPGWVIVSQLADPQWKAHWIFEGGTDYGEAEILPTFHKRDEPGGWQRVEIPGSGRWVLRLTYDARDVSMGLGISLLAWMCWLTLAVYYGFRSAMNA
jgi:hypothetical protein